MRVTSGESPVKVETRVVGEHDHPEQTEGAATGETCDHCGGDSLRWQKCKLICNNCRQINKSCADL